jgi:hypothetical protein
VGGLQSKKYKNEVVGRPFIGESKISSTKILDSIPSHSTGKLAFPIMSQ